MIKMSWRLNLIRVMLLVGTLALIGCSDGGVTPQLPGNVRTLTFDSTGGTLDYTDIDVSIFVPVDTILPGESVPLAVQVAPADLPARCYSSGTYDRMAWLELKNNGDPDITLKDEIVVEFPIDVESLDEKPQANESYSLFLYDPSQGKWVNSGGRATITDDANHAKFSVSSFGTWGIFKAVPLTVDAYADRTTAIAPASISLTAIIDGGAPPYTVTWWFGDESDPKIGLNVGHYYKLPMKYTASCIVIDALGNEKSDTIDLSLH
jgi:hypothetical protein